MTSRLLNVWWDGRIVGQFTQDRHGDIGFVYARAWLDDDKTLPLSASLPKRPERFTRRECRPFFGGLLPEESQRLAAARALGVSPANDFALLDHLGGDVAGALQLLAEGEAPAGTGSIADRQPVPLDEAGIVADRRDRRRDNRPGRDSALDFIRLRETGNDARRRASCRSPLPTLPVNGARGRALREVSWGRRACGISPSPRKRGSEGRVETRGSTPVGGGSRMRGWRAQKQLNDVCLSKKADIERQTILSVARESQLGLRSKIRDF